MTRFLLPVLILLALAFGGCAAAASPEVQRPAALATAVVVVPVAPVGTVAPYSSPTPWPTFTPLPTATVAKPTPTLPPASVSSTPTAEPAGTTTPSPTATPLPTVAAVDVNAVVPDLLATPTPQPLQLAVPDTDVKINRQTLFMSQAAEAPKFWPRSQTVLYTRTARFVGWMIDLDYSAVEPDFKMEGMLRWLNLSSGSEHVIFQRPYVMDPSTGSVLFFMTGREEPGFWHPGSYRVELWDNRDRVVVRYDFNVLSGVLE